MSDIGLTRAWLASILHEHELTESTTVLGVINDLVRDARGAGFRGVVVRIPLEQAKEAK